MHDDSERSTAAEERQTEQWEALYHRVETFLKQFGVSYENKRGDYFMLTDNYGWNRHTIEIQNLKMFAPGIVSGLRAMLNDFPEWEIVLPVDVPEKKRLWPIMGLTIRKHEIIDGLQRQYFPTEFQHFRYEGARPGTQND